MTKITVMYTLLLLFVSPCYPESSSGNQRLDIAMEGPWIFYVQKNFPTANGPSTILVAVAPTVDHHLAPVFSSGDGTQFRPGVYCVVFDKLCIPNPTSTSNLKSDTYPDPNPIPLTKPAWDWKQYASTAYVIILPLPAYYSADGKESLTFQEALPTQATQHVPSSPLASYAIGVQLHYLNGPNRIDLYSCSNATDASSCTKPAATHDEENSGTLRLTIRSDETPTTPDKCRWHVHGAYHSMLGLVDPQLSANPHKRYIDVPDFDKSCTPGDPQQIPHHPVTSMATHSKEAKMKPVNPNIPEELDALVKSLRSLDLAEAGSRVALPALEEQAQNFRGKFLRASDLSKLRDNLAASQTGLTQLLNERAKGTGTMLDKNRHRLRPDEFKLKVGIALQRERTLQRDADLSMLSIYSGKDCRAAIILVQ